MKTNLKKVSHLKTHEGGPAQIITPEWQLRRTVLTCMLWEDTFYEDGQSVSERIQNTIPKVSPEKVFEIAIECREKMKLRHVPLLIIREMIKYPSHKKYVAKTLARVIQRADEICEFLAICNKDGRWWTSCLQIKKGIKEAFKKFTEYDFGKYDHNTDIKLKDALCISHAKPKTSKTKWTKQERKNGIQRPNDPDSQLFGKIIDNTILAPDTWVKALTFSDDKKTTWEERLKEKKDGALTILRNLRRMIELGVSIYLIKDALLKMNTSRVLPFRFIMAARYCPQLEAELEQAMYKCLDKTMHLSGRTILLIDVSGSMDSPMSNNIIKKQWKQKRIEMRKENDLKTDLFRIDAACALAMLLREICPAVEIYTFSDTLVKIPPRRGFALRDAIVQSQIHQGTKLGDAVQSILNREHAERLIVITDEQTKDRVPSPAKNIEHGYMINIGSYENGVGYGAWTHIDGFSESVVNFIQVIENNPLQ